MEKRISLIASVIEDNTLNELMKAIYKGYMLLGKINKIRRVQK